MLVDPMVTINIAATVIKNFTNSGFESSQHNLPSSTSVMETAHAARMAAHGRATQCKSYLCKHLT